MPGCISGSNPIATDGHTCMIYLQTDKPWTKSPQLQAPGPHQRFLATIRQIQHLLHLLDSRGPTGRPTPRENQRDDKEHRQGNVVVPVERIECRNDGLAREQIKPERRIVQGRGGEQPARHVDKCAANSRHRERVDDAGTDCLSRRSTIMSMNSRAKAKAY
ncbi:hypothetical protein BCR44DRAFT_1248958 [Catenaria anguillulae PL171]|uniref:Uncharacterized protein n=1 Tax=Catenaria anguillulae PL171 TaxID=765915 RepID=A0A1Y2HY79_9FUNG|nr:hypothetical protein BCR44DRAFT_1248958 [Catenaria anguillulae PL171]